MSLCTSIPIQIIDVDMGLVLLSVATLSVACGSGALPDSVTLTHANPARLGQLFPYLLEGRYAIEREIGESGMATVST